MTSAERRTLCEAPPLSPWPAVLATGQPPLLPLAVGGLSGRPRCRIFPVGRLWVLQLEHPRGGWLADGPLEPPPRLEFPTLAAAINHAVLHGYDYRIITPGPIARISDGRRRGVRRDRPALSEPTGMGKEMDH
jgi:hypothetical protein